MEQSVIRAFGAWVMPKLEEIGGDTGVYVKDLATGETFIHGGDTVVNAASLIKIPVMIAAFRAAEAGTLSMTETYKLTDADRLPSCGTLKMMHTGIEMTWMDLIRLMITVSDNAATNIIVRRLGMDAINAALDEMNCKTTRINRLLFDADASAKGIRNVVTVREMGQLVEHIWRGEIISQEASTTMLEILVDQRLNGKLPFYLHSHGIGVAHKTGEDDGITHDVGVVLGDAPMLIGFVGEHVDAPTYERLMQDAAKMLCGL